MSTLRINKSTAEDVAKKIAKNSIGKEIEKVENEMAEIGNKVIAEKIPDAVWSVFKKHPEYFYGETKANFVADGLPLICLRGKLAKYPEKRKFGVNTFATDRQTFDNLEMLERRYKELNEQQQSLIYTIKDTLYNLRTLKNIEDNLPEAIPFLPSSFKSQQSLKPALPLDEIKTMLRMHKLESATSNN